MADFNFTKTLNDIGNGLVNLSTDPIKIILLTSAYTPDQENDHLVSDIPVGARIAVSDALASQSWSGAVLDANDITVLSVVAGYTCDQAVIFAADGASPEGGRLLRKISNDTYTGFGFTTDNTDVTLIFPNDAGKIFRLHSN